MGIKWVNAVLQNSTLTGNAKLILVAIANHADNTTGICWPSHDALAKIAHCSDRQLIRCLRSAEDSGELIIRRGDGRGNRSEYQLCPILLADVKGDISDVKGDIGVQKSDTGDTLYDDKRVTSMTSKDDTDDTLPKSDTLLISKPSKNHQKKGSPYSPPFELFWKRWPKQGDTKSTAFAAWKRLSQEEQVLAEGGLTRWLPEYQRRENKFIPDCSTWLNQKRWENNPPPPSNGHVNGNGRVDFRARIGKPEQVEEYENVIEGTWR